MKICGIQGVSLIDFPGRITSILFLGGCNFRCPFCQNRSLVEGYEHLPPIDEDWGLAFLRQRKGFIEGVDITGGEPLINGKELIGFLGRLRETGLSIKLDTNGYNTDMLMKILRKGLVDYIAMDIKTSVGKYHIASGRRIDISRILNSVRAIKESSIKYEFRTTCVPGLVEREDIESIAQLIKGAGQYYLQQFRSDEPTLDPSYMKVAPYSKERLQEFRDLAQVYVNSVGIRGI